MTPEERADILVSKFDGMTFSGGLGTELLRTQLAAEIRAAMEEDRVQRCADDIYKCCYEQGRIDGREEAARIAELDEHRCESPFPPQQTIADKIRALIRK